MMHNPQKENTINEIRKRSGAVTAFNEDKISNYMFDTLITKFENNIMLNHIKFDRFLIKNCIGEDYDK